MADKTMDRLAGLEQAIHAYDGNNLDLLIQNGNTGDEFLKALAGELTEKKDEPGSEIVKQLLKFDAEERFAFYNRNWRSDIAPENRQPILTSELVQRLNNLKRKHGDLPVRFASGNPASIANFADDYIVLD